VLRFYALKVKAIFSALIMIISEARITPNFQPKSFWITKRNTEFHFTNTIRYGFEQSNVIEVINVFAPKAKSFNGSKLLTT
jgi:hypothetical protein